MECTSALSHAYKDKLKPCLDAIDFLRANGMQHEVPLPSIAVVGDQSVGKSSVLEAISGIEFPRGSGIVTRCPLQLSMRYRDDTEWCASIRYIAKNIQITKPIPEPKDVGEMIRSAQNDIAGCKGEIDEAIIEMHVECRDVPDLTLIDLPGIARYSSELGGKVAEVTKNLINSYIERPEVLILVVIPCHVDSETVEAISLAKQVDPKSERTIGVLTHPDMVNPGAERETLPMMQNKKIPLKKGYVSLKCRSQQQLKDNLTLKDSYEEEEKFFSNHPQFRQLTETQRGSKTLASKLSDELFMAIRENIPGMIREVQEWKERYSQQLMEIGDGPPCEESGKKELLASMFRRFCEEFRVVALGIHRHEQNRLYSQFRNHSQEFSNKVHGCVNGETATAKAMWNDVRHRVEKQRGCELPGFDNVYPVLEAMVKQHFIQNVRMPCSELTLAANREVDETLRAIADRHFVDFPLLNQRVKEISERIRSDLVEKTKANVEMVLKQEELIFTQDYLFCEERDRLSVLESECAEAARKDKIIREKEKEKEKKMKKEHSGSATSLTDGFRKLVGKDDSAKISSNHNPLVSVVLESDDKEAAETSAEFLENFVDNNTKRVIHGVRCYMQITVRRIVDIVPMAVMHHMLNGMSEQLSNKMTVMLTEPESLYDMLQHEDRAIASQRIFLRNKIDKLKEAEAQLAIF